MHSNDDDFETLSPEGQDDPPQSRKRAGPSLKARAIGFLSRREHSRVELLRKLTPHCTDPQELEQLLNDLERENWLSNERFAQSLVHRRASRQGTSFVLQELRRHGLAEDTLAELGEQLHLTEFERAQAVWQKKYSAAPINAKDYARQFRFLSSRGFSSECIRRILGDVPYGAD